MRNRQLNSALFVAAFLPALAHTQQPPVAGARGPAAAEPASPLAAPAEFVLRHRAELVLTDAQVSSLQKLAIALRDSAAARGARALEASRSRPRVADRFKWSGPIDEAAFLEFARWDALQMAESTINTERDRRLIGAVLTSEQRAQLPALERAEMTARAARLRRE
jgi:hypothetical protein